MFLPFGNPAIPRAGPEALRPTVADGLPFSLDLVPDHCCRRRLGRATAQDPPPDHG